MIGTEYYVECNECGHVWKVIASGHTHGLDRCTLCDTYDTTRHEEEPDGTPDPEEIRSDITAEDILDDFE